MTWSAPSLRTFSAFSAPPVVAHTHAPIALATCTAMTATPPPAPTTRPLSPRLTRPLRLTICVAVLAARGSAAASSHDRCSGFGKTCVAGTTHSSARPPQRVSPTMETSGGMRCSPSGPASKLRPGLTSTSSPTRTPLASGPTSDTTPARSVPPTCGSGSLRPGQPSRTKTSRRFRAQALTRMRTSAGPSGGLGRSPTLSASRPPWASKYAAFTPAGTAPRALGCRLRGRLAGGHRRDLEDEPAAQPGAGAFGPDAAAMPLQDAARDVEAQPGAALVGKLALVDLLERLEEAFHLALVEAHPAVHDLDADPAVHAARPHGDGAPGRGELER